MSKDDELERQIRSVEAHLHWLKQQRLDAHAPAPAEPAVAPGATPTAPSMNPTTSSNLPTAETLGLGTKVGCIAGAVVLLIAFLLVVFLLPEFLYD